jgi:uncharacterized repeat protein (TIGR04076 family)
MRKKSSPNLVPDSSSATLAEDHFWLYDLKVEVVAGDKPMVCNHQVGDYFLVEGESLVFAKGQHFSMYAIATILPLLPAKQRDTDTNDWMTTDADIACPDPHCGGQFRITRIGQRQFRHSETTGLPGSRGTPYWTKDES